MPSKEEIRVMIFEFGKFIREDLMPGMLGSLLGISAFKSSFSVFFKVSGENETVGGAECVFWDFNLNDGAGDWSPEGCRNESVADGVVRCLCDHLTSFAVIVVRILPFCYFSKLNTFLDEEARCRTISRTGICL